MPSREHYLIGRTGSYLVPDLLTLDAAITRLTGQIKDADPVQRARLWDDIDQLLTRRLEMTTAAETVP